MTAQRDEQRLPGADAVGWTSPSRPPGDACVFVDRDGVINERAPGGFVLTWSAFAFRPDALPALRSLAAAGRPIVVASNQSCVGRGLLARETLVDIMTRMTSALADAGVKLAAWYCCPHAPEASCDCRKPRPGMLLRAARELGFDLSRSHFIGDAGVDAAAGAAAGCPTTLIDPQSPGSFADAVGELLES